MKRGRIQYISQPKYFEAAMKYIGVIEYAAQTDDILREALRVCQSGKPGPVYVEIPSHVLFQTPDWGPLLTPDDYRLVHMPAAASIILRPSTVK